MSGLAVYPKFRSLKPDGSPNSGGKVFTKLTGTSTDKTAYNDAAELTPLSNPVILDSNGEAEIWLKTDAAYRIVVGNSSCTGITDTANIYLDINNIVGIPDLTTATVSLGGTLTLTGNLNTNGYSIVSLNNNNVNLTPGGSGTTNIKNAVLASGNLDTNAAHLMFDTGYGFIDTSSNPFMYFSQTTNAVNGMTLANAATGNAPSLTASGSDTNISLTLAGKGSGYVQVGGIKFPNDQGTTGYVLTLGANGILSWASPTTVFADGYLDGLQISKVNDTTLSVATGTCLDSTNNVTIPLNSSFTKLTNATWAAGSGAGGGNLSASTWYHAFLIKNIAGSVDVGFDTSITATNLLSTSKFDSYRRLGSIFINGSSQITAFTQSNDTFTWTTPVTDKNGTISTAGESVSLTVPPDVNVGATVNLTANSDGVYLSSLEMNNEAPSGTTAPLATAWVSATTNVVIWTNTSKQIRARSVAGVSSTIDTTGWLDNRGKY